jgi:acyl-CoA thioester hydrolase
MNYPYVLIQPVVFRDLDIMGHVNNAMYFTFFETARTNYMFELFELKQLQELPLILASTSCEFRAPAFYGETLLVGTGVARLGSKSFDLLYRVETEGGRLVAEGKSVQVVYDYVSGQTVAIPDLFRERVSARQQGWTPE